MLGRCSRLCFQSSMAFFPLPTELLKQLGAETALALLTGDPGDCRDRMQKKDGEIAHGAMLARSPARARNDSRIVNSP